MPDDTLFQTSDDELLVSAYLKQARTLDDLPYTDQFEAIYRAIADEDPPAVSRQQLFRRLHNLRKAGKLPRLGKALGHRPRLSPEQETLLANLVREQVGELSKRDQLPYTDAFDKIVNTFNTQAGLGLSPHDAWRIIAKLAK